MYSEAELYGLNAGLNKGIKIGRALKKATKQISLKNAIKVAPLVAGSIATGGAGAGAFAIAKKGLVKKAFATGKGMLVKKAANLLSQKQSVQATEPVGNLTQVAPVESVQEAPTTETQQEIQQETEVLQSGAMVENAIAQTQPTIPLIPVDEVPKEMRQTTTPIATTNKSKTLMYVGGAIVLGAIVYLVTKKKNNK